MKKLLITLIMAFAIVFSLAIISSAAEYKSVKDYTKNIEFSTDFGEVTIIEGMTEKSVFANGKNARVVLANGDGTYSTYPTYYILQNTNQLRGIDGSWTGAQPTFDELNKKTGKNYGLESIILIEIPEGITTVAEGVFGRDGSVYTVNTELVVLPESATDIPGQSFRRTNVRCIVLPKSLKSLPSWFACGSSKLEEVVIPKGSQITSIDNAFKDCPSLKYFKVENLTELTTLGSTAFGDCDFDVLDFSFSKLETVNQQALYHLYNLRLVIFPDTVTVCNKVMDSCGSSHPDDFVVVFLGKMTEVDFTWFAAASKIYFTQNASDEVNVKRVPAMLNPNNNALMWGDHFETSGKGTLKVGIWPDSGINSGDPDRYTDADGNKWGYINSKQVEVYFGADETVGFLVRTNKIGENWTPGYLAVFPANEQEVYDAHNNKNITLSSHLIFDTHFRCTEASCTEAEKTTYYCLVCGKDMEVVETAPALGHALEGGVLKGVTYPSGFAKEGFKKIECTRCREIDETTIANAIFKANGYSVAEFQDANGNFAIVGGYTISLEDYDLYEQFNGALKYGIIFVNANGLNNIDFENGVIDLKEDSEGKATVKAVQVEVQNEKEDSENDKETRFTTFNFKVSGFVAGNDTHENLKLLISMYVIKDDVMSFIQSSSEIYEAETVSVNSNEGIALNVFTFGALNNAVSKD